MALLQEIHLPYNRMRQTKTSTGTKYNWFALSPLAIFLSLYLITSILVNDFYKIPIAVAFLISSGYAIGITRGIKLEERIALFSAGAANKNTLLMVWIFILAGAFAQSAEQIGAIDATVNLALQVLPANLLLAGLFIAACFISLSIGTSVGTIVALSPIAVGLAEKAGLDIAFMVAIIVGGSFFGDNLSFISDTTIASTRTQGCDMRDKFKANSMIVIPAAFLVLIFYIIQGWNLEIRTEPQAVEWIKVIPYLVVLGAAIAGINVLAVLVLGITTVALAGFFLGNMDIFVWFAAMGKGISSMADLIIVTLLAGGLLEMIRYNGGIDYIIHCITRHINGKRGAEFSIAALVSIANICTANNTIAILTAGPIAKDIASRFGIDSRKAASLLDTFSCFIQGIIPYGAQLLMAAGLAHLSPLQIIQFLYYPFTMGVLAILSIVFRFPKKYS